MSQGIFFIAGTDTGVGKTAVSCALLAAARTRGLTTAAIKPVASGAADGRSEDALLLQQLCTQAMSYEAINPVALAAPIAPHLAARQVRQDLRAEELAEHCRAVMALGADLTVIEGVGGWLTPLNDEQTMADVVALLAVPVVLVVGMRLGCLNHALLSAAAMRAAGVELRAWVANVMPGPEMLERDANRDWLGERLDAVLLGDLPRVADVPARGLAGRLAEHLALPF